MRTLAREAVIFVLLTPIVVFVGSFAYSYHETHKSVRFDMSAAQPIPCTEGDQHIERGRLVWSCEHGVRTESPATPVTQAQHVESGSDIDLSAGLVPKSASGSDPYAGIATPVGGTNTPVPELLGGSLLLGLYGFPTGLGLWVFYRVVRFAING
jgi:hypothetical protein